MDGGDNTGIMSVLYLTRTPSPVSHCIGRQNVTRLHITRSGHFQLKLVTIFSLFSLNTRNTQLTRSLGMLTHYHI